MARFGSRAQQKKVQAKKQASKAKQTAKAKAKLNPEPKFGSMQNVYSIANEKQKTMEKLGNLFQKKNKLGLFTTESPLKRGVITMAKKAGASEEQMDYLQSLSNEELERFYRQGVFDFKEYFAYENHGIHGNRNYADLTERNQAEIQKFIDATAPMRA